MYKVTKITCLLLALTIAVKAHVNDGPSCAHHLFKETPVLIDVEEAELPKEDRLLQTVTYPSIRIQTDYTRITDGTTEFKSYVQNDLLPPVIDYFQAALDIKKPLISAIKISSTTICGYATPDALKTGALTDFFVMVTSTTDNSSNWVASAGACSLSSTTHRPIIARMMFNLVYTKAAAGDVLTHERNMYLTMHEMFHAFGFTGSSFPYFINDDGTTKTGHIKTILLNGSNRTVIDVEPLTSKLRAHFGCSTLEGAYMEDDGGAGTEGSHFERRHFIYDTMTSGVIDGRRITEFDLAMLEGSGWYMPNYTFAEPFFFGQGEGCSFLKEDCSLANADFPDFCTGSSRGCTQVGRGGGVCTSDTRSDGCRYNIPDIDYDCENTAAADNARYPELQVFGRTAGSKCFEGTLTKLTSSSQTSWCFKYTCSGSGLTTSLSVNIGGAIAKCVTGGQIKLSGYNGYIQCPDPLTFCNTVGKKYCPRGCVGRGTCVNNTCVCNSGFTGVDCALRTNSSFV